MITENLSQSVGSADPTTSPTTGRLSGVQVRVICLPDHYPVEFTWHKFVLHATVWREQSKRSQGGLISWKFSTKQLTTPSLFLQHELPIFATFLLECHKRLSASTRGNRFNPAELEG